eukprot:Skav227081  [mRNA]  locus=scaffold1387:128305:134481:+ [translate_table: standard]
MQLLVQGHLRGITPDALRLPRDAEEVPEDSFSSSDSASFLQLRSFLTPVHSERQRTGPVAHTQSPVCNQISKVPLRLEDCVPSFSVTTTPFETVLDRYRTLLALPIPLLTHWPGSIDWTSDHGSAWSSLPHWNGEPPIHLAFFTDGSRQSTSATGSGIILIVTTAQGDQAGGMLAIRGPDGWAGLAEHHGMSWALLWAIQIGAWCQQQSLAIWPSFSFHYDATVTGNLTAGTWASKENGNWHVVLRSLGQVLQIAFGQHRITWHHVYAHQGHAYNEIVDELAKYASLMPHTSNPVLEWIDDPEALLQLQWLWMIIPASLHHPAFPSLIEGKLVHTKPTISEYKGLDIHSPPTKRTETTNCCLRVATANVLSLEASGEDFALHPGSRQQSIMRQFQDQRFHLVALQETRHRQETLPDSQSYSIVGHPADGQGHGGLQLWLNTKDRFGPSSRPFRPQDCSIVEATTEWMICKLRHPDFRCVVVVGHSPHSMHGLESCNAFWDRITTCLKARCRGWKILFLGDSNAHLGQYTSDSVGPLHAEDENPAGEAFHEWLIQWGLWLPSTFSAYHHGSGGTYLHPTESHWRRLDYVGIDQTLSTTQVSSWVADSIDISLKRIDHLVAACDISFTSATSHRVVKPGASRGDIQSWIQAPEAQSILASQLPLPGRNVDVHAHAELLSGSVASVVAAHVPICRMKPLKRTLTETTWALLKEKQQFRKRYFGLLRARERALASPTCPGISFLESELDHCRAMLKWYGAIVKQATRNDDKAFFTSLAQRAGHADSEGGLQKIWRQIRYMLPRHRGKRRRPQQDLHEALLQHFERLEAGTTTSFAEAWNNCLAHQQRCTPCDRDVIALDTLPTLYELEQICRKQTSGKAPGLDGLLPDFVHLLPATFAVHLHTLLQKSLVAAREPFQFKGGRLVALHKGNGHLQQADRYRGILLSSTMAKVGHAWLRSRLLPIFQQIRSPGQLGGRPHQQTAVAMHALRLHSRRARMKKLSTAILFVDLRSAYHHLLRELVFDIKEPLLRAELSRIFTEVDYDIDALAAHLQQQCEAFDGLVPPAIRDLLADVHQHTWFMLSDPDSPDGGLCTVTKRGTRPGSPLADLGFGFLLARLMRRLEAFLEADETFCTGCDLLGMRTPIVIWADDIAVTLAAASPSALTELLSRTTSAMWDLLRDAGLSLNLEAKKTEAVVMFRGKGAVEARLQLFQEDRPPHLVVPCRDHIISLRISPSYKHLGGRYGMTGDLQDELVARQKDARRAYAELRRPLFGNRRISVRTRLQLLQSLVISKLLYGAAVWADLSPAQLHSLDTSLMKWVRAITGNHLGNPEDRVSDASLRATHRLPTVRQLLAKIRLRFLHFVVHWADSWYVDLLLLDAASEGSWLGAVAIDLRWLFRTVEVPSSLTDAFEQGWAPFFDAVKGFPSWCALIHRAFLRCVQQETNATHTFDLHHDILTTMTAQGVVLSEPASTTPTEESPDQHPCPHCPRTFCTRQHLGAHLFSAHGVHSEEQGLTHSTVCGGCLKNFRTTARAAQHLRYRENGCYAKLSGHRELQPPQPIDLPESLRQVKRLPCFRQHSGPLRPSPLERYRSHLQTERYWLRIEEAELTPSVDATSLDFARDLLWRRCAPLLAETSPTTLPTYLDRYVDIVLDLFATHGAGIELLCIEWLETQIAADHPEQVRAGLRFLVDDWASALPLWEIRQRLRRIVYELEDDLEEIPPPRTARASSRPRIRDDFPLRFDSLEAWEAGRHACLVEHWPTIPEPLDPGFYVYVHLYSGRRRPGDVHSWLECYLAPLRQNCVILSLDTAVHEDLNVWSSRLWNFLLAIAEGGKLAALLMGPPCETWTAARHRSVRDLWGNVVRGPRPVRSRTNPWGLGYRGLAELKQVDVGTSLLLRGVHLAVITALRGGIVLGEHPREVPDPIIPSIWSTAIIQTLLQGPTPFRLVHLEQWEFGAKGVKPTTILAAHTDLDYWLRQMKCTWLPRPQFALVGKDAQGTFRTASAKEYPSLLNRAFAAAMSVRKLRVCAEISHDTLLEAAREFESLCHTFHDRWRADYQPI